MKSVPGPGFATTGIRHTFCVLPWIHGQVNPEGTVKPCCRALGSIEESGRAMSLYAYRFEQIWNSGHMRTARFAMANGQTVADCALCYQDEDRGQQSYRQASNDKWLKLLQTSEAALVADTAERNHACQDFPVFLQFNLGNLCNLKCRMCSSSYSSQIARDAVHDKWSPQVEFHKDGLLRWQGNTLHLGPTANAGYGSGFHDPELHEDLHCRWTNGAGEIELPLDGGTRISAVQLDVLAYRPICTHGADAHIPLTVTANGEPIYTASLPRGVHRLLLDLSGVEAGDLLRLGLNSSIYRREGNDKTYGVGVLGLTLTCDFPEKRPAPLTLPIDMRFVGRRPWYEQRSLIYGELLDRVNALREIYFTGGEPLISPEAIEIIDYLIESGVAAQMTVQLNSNCTRIPERWLAALARFGKVDFALSLDGIGDCYEYIRYPARWPQVSANIHKLKSIPNISMTAVPIMHAYNMLEVVALCRYCDSVGIRFALMEHHGHRHLDLAAMPPAARMLAAERLRGYLESECREENAGTVRGMIRFLETVPDRSSPEVLREFMLFTNDLDEGRAQSFRRSHRELLGLIESSGSAWTEETRYFGLPAQDTATDLCMEPQTTPISTNLSLPQAPASADLIERAQALCDHGEKLYSCNDPTGAKQCFQQAVQLDLKCARAYNNLGVILWHAEEREAALEVLGRAVALIPDDRTCILNYVGMMVANNQDLHKAKSLMVGYLLKHPHDREAATLYLELES